MSVVLRLANAQLAFGTAPVLDQAELVVEQGERVCITGRNGAGKSSLLKVLQGDLQLDGGELHYVGNTRVAMLPQDPPPRTEGSVFHYVIGAFAETGALLEQYQELSQRLANHPDDAAALSKLTQIQSRIEAAQGWQLQTQVEQVLSRLSLDGAQAMANLSGGWLRRAALARALATNPDILLLDEPTNHLDVNAVKWLENMLLEFRGAIIFISHDRAFIRRLATRIVDLDRGTLTSFPGDYAAFLVEKQRLLEVEASQNAEFDKKLAQEEVWIRQGIKARRTRNEGRVRALQELRKQRSQRRQVQGQVKFDSTTSERSGKVVFEAKDLALGFGDKTLIENLTITIQRGDKLALVGPNGCGKSSLIRCILGDLEPQSGTYKLGTNLQVAYFDQHRQLLDENLSVADNVAEGKKEVTHGGRTRHIFSYLQDFLFSPQQAQMPVRALSGGEKNRVMLAKILLRESNLLVLDEPTNDLDIDTLELLEQVVVEYPGTVFVVSHDREFIDNTATSVLLFEGAGKVTEIVGGFNEVAHYQAAQQEVSEKAKEKGTISTSEHSDKQSSLAKSSNKLSYKLKRELELLPKQIDELEAELELLQQQINDPEFFRKPVEQTQPITERFATVEQMLMEALERWDYLENLQGN
ncbi:ATP-binding cassette domain-containing protein [Aliidiomarina haloalkalitolerans]|uniref:ATP-binding protein Uup n=1 Tax=Aliidiomarina haloalkalitolerans TaxID=859059 RepID=A0A432VYG4_9GAMM|nr:ATP-binding cassette domain-containing protein [Aliidiomarina haloalkalitolerans]RUO21655.1 ABC transporter ATP-binding protein [Aliidiomarina haloalkalitolerans]